MHLYNILKIFVLLYNIKYLKSTIDFDKLVLTINLHAYFYVKTCFIDIFDLISYEYPNKKFPIIEKSLYFLDIFRIFYGLKTKLDVEQL